MKKFVSLLLVLLLALTSATAVNAKGVRDIFGTVNARGAYTVINNNHGIVTNVVDYPEGSESPFVYASGGVSAINNEISYALGDNGLPKKKPGIESEKASNAEMLWDTTSNNTLNYTYQASNVGSFLLYDEDTNRYHIDSWELDTINNGLAQKVTYDNTTEKFSYEDYNCTADISGELGNAQNFLYNSFRFHYALSISANFNMPAGGNLSYNNNGVHVVEPMRFDFAGDDLVLVYIDGVRVLNGSIQWGHMAFFDTPDYNINPSIDFSTGIVHTMTSQNRSSQTTLYDIFSAYYDELGYNAAAKESALAAKFDRVGDNYILKEGTHEFKMFYAETAGGRANCKVSFNLLADEDFATTPPSEPPYNLLFVDYQYDTDVAHVYREMSNYTNTTLELTKDIATDFEFEDLPFAGWFETREAAASGYVYNNTMRHVDLSCAYAHNVTLSNYPKGNVTLPVMINGTKQNVTYPNAIVFYAGWIPEISQQKAAEDNNVYGTANVGAFDLAGVQIRGSDVDDIYQNPIRNRTYDALRFVTSYSLSFLDEIKSLSRANGGSTVLPEYGYFAVSDLNGNIFNKSGYTINSQGGSKKVDCTKTGDENHHYYNGYLLSTMVIKYDDHPQYKGVPVEARAYIYYKDANGNMRYNDDTYGTETGETTFWGGCRTSFNAAYNALSHATDTMHYV
ncbi:MAG: hypothetical protein K6F76_07930 [Clostridiales bacterium]|nr:hypothetical protein [Clostridiales bacterium]